MRKIEQAAHDRSPSHATAETRAPDRRDLAVSSGPAHPGPHTRHAPRYQPAFFDTRTNAVHISRYPDGRPAPVHLTGSLPEGLRQPAPEERVVAGYVYEQQFYTRSQLSRRCEREEAPHRVKKCLSFW